MSPYEKYEIADFVLDDYFRNWVFAPTDEMNEFWEEWIKLHPDKKEAIRQARLLLLSIDFNRTPTGQIPARDILQRIQSSIRQVTEADVPQKRLAFPWHRMAAVFVGVMITAFLLLYLMNSLPGNEVKIETAYSHRREVTLPDHSVVTLNANTRLRYQENWNEHKPREVWLDGEAFFEITKSPGKGNARFIVHTNDLDVEVLGTVFNVNSRDDKTRVVLNSGKVKLSSSQTDEKEITMQPGELAELKKGHKKFLRKVVDPDIYSSWTDNRLIFNQTSFNEIVDMIKNNYGYTVEAIPGRIANETFTATIPDTELNVLIDILSRTYDVTFTRSGHIIRITDNRNDVNN